MISKEESKRMLRELEEHYEKSIKELNKTYYSIINNHKKQIANLQIESITKNMTSGLLGLFIKPIPEGVKADCLFEKGCKNKGRWNIQNGNTVFCDKHFLKYMRENEGKYIIINKSLKTLLKSKI